jgi:hypothetical protein
MNTFLTLVVLAALAAAAFIIHWAGVVGHSGCAVFC